MPVIEFVESKYEEYLTAESRVHRKAITDNRVHTCLYFIAPSGHGLKTLDVEFMQRLCDKVNIIPVIAKADTMTPEEVQLFKKQVKFDSLFVESGLCDVKRRSILDLKRNCSTQNKHLRFPRTVGGRRRSQSFTTAEKSSAICNCRSQFRDRSGWTSCTRS